MGPFQNQTWITATLLKQLKSVTHIALINVLLERKNALTLAHCHILYTPSQCSLQGKTASTRREALFLDESRLMRHKHTLTHTFLPSFSLLSLSTFPSFTSHGLSIAACYCKVHELLSVAGQNRGRIFKDYSRCNNPMHDLYTLNYSLWKSESFLAFCYHILYV